MTGSERVVWKYTIPAAGELALPAVPMVAKVVHFAIQHDEFTFWMERPVDRWATRERQYIVRGTGHTIPAGDWQHRGSTMTANGSFVFHLYERTFS